MVSRVHAKNLVAWAKNRPQVLVLSADLTSSTEIDLFRETYPDRFFSMGIAEQNMLSVAGGLAREGFLPFVHTFAVFIYRRAYDQIAMSVAYPNLPVRMVGFLPGITTPGGATHQAIEDIALMRSLPNMTVLECGDATDVQTCLDVIEGVKGPVYVRMLRGEIPRLFKAPMKLDEPRLISDGSDISLFSSGILTEEAMRASLALRERDVSVHHMHINTLKPMEHPSVLAALGKPKYGVISMENHTVVGGLGSILAEKMAEHGIGKKLVRIGLPDVFAHGASRPYLLREYGLDAMALVGKVESLLGRTLGIGEKDLAEVRLEAVHSDAKAEGL
jgi:transketolase